MSGFFSVVTTNVMVLTFKLLPITTVDSCLLLSQGLAGVMGDKEALGETTLKDLIKELPFGLCVIADAAYCPTEHSVPVFQGLAKHEPKYDNFNFYASQLRIRIEMAFGIMNMKWGILNHPLGCAITHVKWVVQAIGSLHNYCWNHVVSRVL